MTDNKRTLELLAYAVNWEKKITFWEVVFPKKWFEELYAIYQILNDRETVNLPIYNLNAALKALPLGIVETKKVNRNQLSWLTLLNKIELQIIYEILISWIVIEFIGHTNITPSIKERLKALIEAMDIKEVVMKERVLDLSKRELHQNGTAAPDGNIYSILPAYITSVIAHSQLPIKIEGKSYCFIKCNNELISYPPSKSSQDYFSIGIKFSVKTIATVDQPVVLIHTKVKKWANGNKVEGLAKDKNTSIYIKYNQKGKWDEAGTTLGLDKISYDKANKEFEWVWKTKLILEYNGMNYLPPMDEVLAKSEQFLGSEQPFSILIMHNQYNEKDHEVKSGFEMKAKEAVYQAIEEYIPLLVPIDKTSFRPVRKSMPKTALSNDKEKILVNYLAAINTLVQELTIEILYINDKTKEAIIQCILKELEIELETINLQEEVVLINYKGLKLHLKSKYSGGLTSNVGRYHQRVKETQVLVGERDESILTIAEIKDKEYYKFSKQDAKPAIRRGLYEQGRLNQFVVQKGGLNEDKLKNVVLELFRQKGLMLDKININTLKTIPKSIEIVGFTLLYTDGANWKEKICVPIATSVTPGSQEILVKTPYSDWMPYDKTIIHLGSRDYKKGEKWLDKQAVNKFFKGILYDIKDQESLIIVDTSNTLNIMIPELQDRNLDIDNCFKEFPRTRVIRIKDNEDIPDYLGTKEDMDPGFISGVIQVKEKVFYSIPAKSNTYPKRNYESKLENQDVFIKYPKLVEIVPIKLLENDNQDEFVYLVHKLRLMNLTYKYFTNMPFIIHLGRKLQEAIEVKDPNAL